MSLGAQAKKKGGEIAVHKSLKIWIASSTDTYHTSNSVGLITNSFSLVAFVFLK